MTYKRNRYGRLIFYFFIVLILLTFFSNTINNYTLPRVQVANPQINVTLLKEVRGDGYIRAKGVYDLSLDKESVKIKSVKVNPGDTVSEGQVLFEIEYKDIKNIIEQETLKYEQMKYTYDVMCSEKSSEKIFDLAYRLDNAKQNRNSLRQYLADIEKLYKVGGETLKKLEQTRSDFENAEEEYRYLLKKYNNSVNNREEEIKKYEYSLRMQELKLKELQKTSEMPPQIVSPVSGIAKELYINNGVWLNPHSRLMTLTVTEKGFQFIAQVSESEAEYLKIGDGVKIELKAEGEDSYGGVVANIQNNSDHDGYEKEIVVDIMIGDNVLSGGERGQLITDKSTNAYQLVVPNSAVVPASSPIEGYIYIVKGNRGFLGNEYRIQRVTATILDSDNTRTAISAPITEDAMVVINTDKPLYDKGRVIVEY